jgi:hypothetical protein
LEENENNSRGKFLNKKRKEKINSSDLNQILPTKKEKILSTSTLNSDKIFTTINNFNDISKHIKIIDFAPNYIHVNSTSKILIIIESYLNYQNLKLLENEIKIKFGSVLMPCTVINSTTISSIIPCSQEKEITIEIMIGKESVSTCDPEMKLKYINNINHGDNNSIKNINISNKDGMIFKFTSK